MFPQLPIRSLWSLFLLALVLSGGTSCYMTSTAGSQGAKPQVVTSISPATASVESGGSLQFTANVSGTTQTSVTWSASTGSISSSGLLHAPTVSADTSITVSASSVADAASTAIANITITAPPPLISTSSLPVGTVGVNYSATFTATGGELPYRWSLVSGSLPTGLQLIASTGTMNGSPADPGSSTFVVEVTDNNSRTAQQSFNITISSTTSEACGPPTYPCSRTDFNVITATSPPQLGSNPKYYGGHSGAGTVATDPAYGNRILRVTDGNTDVNNPGMSFGTSWSAEANLISSDESLFFVTNEGSTPCLFEFNSGAFQTKFHGCRYHSGAGNLQFGYTVADASAFYNYSGNYLYRFVIDRTTWGITKDSTFNKGQGYFDPDGPECLNGQLAASGQWYVQDTSLSSDDSTFAAEMGREQDISPYVVIWNATKGCRWMNVRTWEASAGWNTGLTNPAKIVWVSGKTPTAPGGMHNVELDRSGQYAVLAINGTSLTSKVFWDVDTNVVNDSCLQCWSHWGCDFGVCFWAFAPPGQQPVMRDLAIVPAANMGSMMGHKDLPATPSSPSANTDEHVAHQNATVNEKKIYLMEESWDSGEFEIQGLWDDELIGVNWDGSKRTIRFNKTWSSGFAGCPISRAGHFAICSSDYQMYNKNFGFGDGLNQDTCVSNAVSSRGTTACRHDVLLFELR